MYPQVLIKTWLIISILLFGFFNGTGEGEKRFCKTPLTEKQIEFELNHIINSREDITGLDKPVTLGVSIHMIQKNGQTPVKHEEALQAIGRLNKNFRKSNIRFAINRLHYHENPAFFNFNAHDEAQMTNLYHTSNSINLYVVKTIKDKTLHNPCGFTYYPSEGKNYIVIKGNCLTINSSLTHEMGHLFGLYHTHETSFGKETVSQDNCWKTGDLICDTPADPKLSGNKVNDNCIYTALEKDSNNTFYHPPVRNYMSYSPKTCRNHFTPIQIKKMEYNYLRFKTKLKTIPWSISNKNTRPDKGEPVSLKISGVNKARWNTGESGLEITVLADSSQTIYASVQDKNGQTAILQYQLRVKKCK